MTAPRPSIPSRAHLAHECLVCGTALSGPGAVLLRLVGIARSHGNPNLCTRCNTHVESGQILEVTVLFADLSGFTALTRELGPARTHDVVDVFLQRASRAVVGHDGYVDKFIGDAVMAIFNAPIARTDHATAAFRAAIEIQGAMPELSTLLGRNLHATVGIARGYARLGAEGRAGARAHTLLGEVVNLAARLQSRAQPGDVLIDESVYRELRAVVGEVPEERLDLKGFAEPIACRRIGPGTALPPLTPARRWRSSSLGFSGVAFALLGAPCAVTVAVTPVAVWLGVASAAAAAGTVSFGNVLDHPWIRIPVLLVAALSAVANLAAVHHASRLRRERLRGGLLPSSNIDRRRTRWATWLSVLTLLIVVAERVAHVWLHPHG